MVGDRFTAEPKDVEDDAGARFNNRADGSSSLQKGCLQKYGITGMNAPAAVLSVVGAVVVVTKVGVVIVVVLLRTSLQLTSRFGALCMGAVIGGALGNLIDRVAQPGPGLFGGKVTDFIDLQWWPIFNVADIALTVGGLLLVLTGLHRAPGRDAGES